MATHSVRISDPQTGVVLDTDLKWHRNDQGTAMFQRFFEDLKSAEEFGDQLNMKHPELEIWIDDISPQDSTLAHTGEATLKRTPQGAQIYSVANLCCMLLLVIGVISLIQFFFDPLTVLWVVFLPTTVFFAGFLQERLLSGFVNSAISKRQTKRG